MASSHGSHSTTKPKPQQHQTKVVHQKQYDNTFVGESRPIDTPAPTNNRKVTAKAMTEAMTETTTGTVLTPESASKKQPYTIPSQRNQMPTADQTDRNVQTVRALPRKPPVKTSPLVTSTTESRESNTLSQKQIYINTLLMEIRQQTYYPRGAKRRQQEGKVVVSFVIDARGYIHKTRIRKSSGHQLLDQAALKTIERVSPLQAPPASLMNDILMVSAPISFSLAKE
jgi:protein TonB